MPIATAQDRRADNLRERFAVVTERRMPDGTLSLIAYPASSGPSAVTPAAAELLDGNGLPLPPHEAIRRLGSARTAELEAADAALEAIIAHVARRVLDGEDVNLSELARDAGLSRTTLYNRLAAIGVATDPE